MDTLSPLESIFLNIEDGVTHMHLGSCAIFDGPAPSFDEIAALIASKLALAPRLRQRLQSVPFALGHPVWIDDVEFDLRNHLHAAALPSPGRDTELTDFVGRVMSSELNRHRPLWEIWLLEGVVDHSSNRPKWALVGKAHHAMVDGIAGADLLARLLDAESDAKLQPTDRWVPRRAPTAAALAAQAVRNAVVAPAQRAIDMTKRDTKRGVSTYSFASQLSRLGFGLSSFAAALRPSAPLSIVGNIGAERRWAVARCQLDDVKQIRKVLGGSVNDVLLTAIAGAFRTILLARGDVIDETTIVRSLIPVSLRLFDDRSTDNQLSLVIFELPVGIDDVTRRHETTCRQMSDLKRSPEVGTGAAVLSGANLVPHAMLAAMARLVMRVLRTYPQRSIHTVTTNVPGPVKPHYVLGRELREYLPFVPITEGMRFGVAVLSYNGHVAFGVTGDYDTAPDVGRFATAIEAELEVLLKRTEHASAGPTSRRRVPSGGG